MEKKPDISDEDIAALRIPAARLCITVAGLGYLAVFALWHLGSWARISVCVLSIYLATMLMLVSAKLMLGTARVLNLLEGVRPTLFSGIAIGAWSAIVGTSWISITLYPAVIGVLYGTGRWVFRNLDTDEASISVLSWTSATSLGVAIGYGAAWFCLLLTEEARHASAFRG